MADYIDATQGAIRDAPLTSKLKTLLLDAADEVGIEAIRVTSAGQPGSTGKSTGSARHNGGRAADFQMLVDGEYLSFSDTAAPEKVTEFLAACARAGATGIGAGVGYMGRYTVHVGYGLPKTVWGKDGKRKNAPQWLVDAVEGGWRASGILKEGSFVISAREGTVLRSGPGSEYGVVRHVAADTFVAILAFDGPAKDWARVDLIGDGYVDGHVHVSHLREAARLLETSTEDTTEDRWAEDREQ